MELSELQKVVVYDGYKPNDATIQLFWEVRSNIYLKNNNNIGARVSKKRERHNQTELEEKAGL